MKKYAKEHEDYIEYEAPAGSVYREGIIALTQLAGETDKEVRTIWNEYTIKIKRGKMYGILDKK